MTLVICLLTALIVAQSAVIFALLNRVLMQAGVPSMRLPKLPIKAVDQTEQPKPQPRFSVPIQA